MKLLIQLINLFHVSESHRNNLKGKITKFVSYIFRLTENRHDFAGLTSKKTIFFIQERR